MVRILFCLTLFKGVSMKIVRMTMLSLLLLMIAFPLYAGGRLTYYCSTDIPWCELMKKEFEKRTGIRVSMTRASSGETD